LHVRDAAEAIVKCLESDIRGTYNLGGQNMKIIDVANEIKDKTGCEVKVYSEIKDPRNYIVDSSRIMKSINIGYKYTIHKSVEDIRAAYEGKLISDYRLPIYSNFEWLRQLGKS